MKLTLLMLFCVPLCCAALALPAEQRIAAARQVLKADPNSSQAYNDLASALCRRARETGDVEFFPQAEAAVAASLKIAPGNYEAQKLRAAILLGNHDYTAALRLAESLNKSVPDDIPVWGFLVDANIALGNYPAAEKAAQWMLDLRPGNAPAFVRSAQLREVFGDLDGTLEFLEEAYRRTPDTELEERAFLLTETARVHLLAGDKRRAEALLLRVLASIPEYHLALRTLASLRTEEGKYDEALDLLRTRARFVKSADSAYELAEALDRAGKSADAAKAFGDFLARSQAETKLSSKANRQLIFYYLNHSSDPAKALSIAEKEVAARHDVFTQDAYAWALFKNKKTALANSELSKALAVGVRDPEIFCHAGLIAASAGEAASSREYLKQASSSCAAPKGVLP